MTDDTPPGAAAAHWAELELEERLAADNVDRITKAKCRGALEALRA